MHRKSIRLLQIQLGLCSTFRGAENNALESEIWCEHPQSVCKLPTSLWASTSMRFVDLCYPFICHGAKAKETCQDQDAFECMRWRQCGEEKTIATEYIWFTRISQALQSLIELVQHASQPEGGSFIAEGVTTPSPICSIETHWQSAKTPESWAQYEQARHYICITNG